MLSNPLILSVFAFAYQNLSEDTRQQLQNLGDSPSVIRDRILETYVLQLYEHEERKHKMRNPPEEMPFSYQHMAQILKQVALFNAGKEAVNNAISMTIDFGDALNTIGAETFVDLILKMHILVRDENDSLRFIHTILRDYFAIKPAIEMVNPDCTFTERRIAIAALRNIEDARAIEPILMALQDSNPYLRRQALKAADRKDDARIVDALICMLDDHNDAVRQNAILALGRTRNELGLHPLIQLLSNSNVRQAVLSALGRLGYPQAIPYIEPFLEDQDTKTRNRARRALSRIGTSDALKILDDHKLLRRNKNGE